MSVLGRATLRRATIILAAVATIPLLATSATAANPTVTFTGKPLLGVAGVLTCPSNPDTSQLTVAAGTAVDVVNATGRTAVLHVGSATATVPDRSSVPVTFNAGPDLPVTMIPDCRLDMAKHAALTVHIAAAASAPPPTGTPPPIGTPTPTAATSPVHGAQVFAHATIGPHVAAASQHPQVTVPSPPSATSAPPSDSVAGPFTPPDDAPNYFLTLIAIIIVIGVGWAAIRAVIEHRRGHAHLR